MKKNPLIAKALGCVKSCLEKYVPKDSIIILGCSGGQDSMALLNILLLLQRTYPLQIHVAHVNHGIRKESIEEEKFLQTFCENLKIPIHITHLHLEKQTGLADKARSLRYQFFYELKESISANYIFTAHTKSDNVETILMHIIRGSGLNGLSGIKEANENIIRPILNLERSETQQICDLLQIPYVRDPTNEDQNQFRVDVRKNLFPFLEKYNPNILESISSLGNQASDISIFLNSEAKKSWFFHNISGNSENVYILQFGKGLFDRMNTALVINQLRYYFNEFGIKVDEIKYSIYKDIYKAILNKEKKNFCVKPNFLIQIKSCEKILTIEKLKA